MSEEDVVLTLILCGVRMPTTEDGPGVRVPTLELPEVATGVPETSHDGLYMNMVEVRSQKKNQ